jgi:23S rRNA (adenine2503-C2)-methyltransferase
VNDHRQHARELAELLRTVPCKINLIPFNPFEGSDYKRSSSSAISVFRSFLQDAGYTVTIRTTRGDEIGAACGQLVGQVDDRTRRSARHLAQRQAAASESGIKPVRVLSEVAESLRSGRAR